MSYESKFVLAMVFVILFMGFFGFGFIRYRSYLVNQLQLAKIQHNCDK